jgi:hypothetical protein
MELMTDKSYYPAVGTWRIWPRLTGEDRGIPWLAVSDVGVVAAAVFAQPDTYIGQSLSLLADVKSLAECRAILVGVTGKPPRTFPLPIWLFDRFTRGDVSAMWRWLETGDVPMDTEPTRSIHPGALTVREWMAGQRSNIDQEKGADRGGER